MQTEIEVKFLNVNHDEIREKLKKLGAVCEQPMRLMRRAMFDYPDNRFQLNDHSRRLRVRDEGDKITVTFKQKNETPYPHEVETTVGSYDEMVKIFEQIGFKVFSYQESKRETWHHNDVEVVLDEWPWLNAYIEIEGKSEDSIKKVAKDLGFDWGDSYFGSVDTAYMNQYPKMTKKDSIGDVPEVKFETEIPKYLTERK